jgi:hypothetical protein
MARFQEDEYKNHVTVQVKAQQGNFAIVTAPPRLCRAKSFVRQIALPDYVTGVAVVAER